MKKNLMIATMLIFVGNFCENVFAVDLQCRIPPSCADLGYKAASCSNNNGIKCPWGNTWFCPPEIPETCKIGSIIYSDLTCFKEVKSNKTPIGIVVYVDGLGGGQAVALNSLDKKYQWGGYGIDIPELTNYSSSTTASQDYASCENSKIIMAQGDKIAYPAVWAAHEYSTEGTSPGDWCLPAAGIFTSYKNNQDLIDTGFEKVNGTKFTTDTRILSSSEYNRYTAWYSYIGYSNWLDCDSKDYRHEVRPVFEFTQTAAGICKGTFQYTCSDDGIKGIGETCGGRYEKCTCEDGYVFKGEACVSECEAGSELGYILYSDMTRSAELDTNKTPIGVVVCSYLNGGGQALALELLSNSSSWGNYGTDIPNLINFNDSKDASFDLDSCANTEKIIMAGDASTYPAAWNAHEYSTEGTSPGDWCLPAAGIFTSIRHNLNLVNTQLANAGGQIFTSGVYAWTSSEKNSTHAFTSDINSAVYGITHELYNSKNTNYYKVWPVIEF